MERISKTIAKNSASIAAADITVRLASFIFNIFVVRQLGGADFGKYSTVMAYVGVFAVFSDLGAGTYATREIAQDKSKTGFLIWNTIMLRIALSLIVIPGITASAFLLGYPKETVTGIFLASLALLLHAFYGPIVSLTRGYERMELRSIYHVVERVVFLLIGAFVLLKGLSFLGLIVGTLISVLVTSIVGGIIVIKYIGRFPFEMNPRVWWGLLKASAPFGAITLTLMVADRIDTVILSLWTEDVVVGLYALAYGLMISVQFFSATLNGALGPTLARVYSGSRETVNRVYQTSFRMHFTLSLPITIGTMILAGQIIPLLYTDEFLPAVPAYRVLIWAMPLMSLHNLCSSMATAAYREKSQARIRVAAAVANVAMNFYAIPHYGLMGAAVVTFVTELMIFVLMFRLVNDQFVLEKVFHIIGKPTLAALVMGVVVYAARDLNLFVNIGLGAVVYGAILMVTKGLDLRDPTSVEAALFRNVMQRLRGFARGSL